MTAAYAPESWDGFALAVVTAAATLTGLLSWLVSGFFPAVVSCGCLVVAAATLLAHAGGACTGSSPARSAESRSASSTPGSS
jgi:hypothetical protein